MTEDGAEGPSGILLSLRNTAAQVETAPVKPTLTKMGNLIKPIRM